MPLHTDVYQRAPPLPLCRYTGGTPLLVYQAANGSVMPGAPGPTIRQCVGRQSLVRFCNRSKLKVGRLFSVHLHGAASTAQYDGWADDITNDGFCKDYLYPSKCV